MIAPFSHLLLFFNFFLAINSLTIPKIVARSSWTSLGCYTDNVSGHTLSNGFRVPGGTKAMTNQICQATCLKAGYAFAGTENGEKCRCGRAVINGGGPAPDGDAQCNMPCRGDATQICGGLNRLNLWQYGSSATHAATPAQSLISTRAATPTSSIVSTRAATPTLSIASTRTTTPTTSHASTLAPTPASSPSSSPTLPPTPTSGKRGLVYNNNNPGKNAQFANVFTGYNKISWGYNYGYSSLGLNPAWEFVPMLWGLPSGPAPTWTASATAPGVKSILGFNEPDLTYSASSNIIPAKAAAGYKQYMEPFSPQVKVGMPSVLWNNDHGSSSGGHYSSRVWTQYFMGNCTGCHFDFMAIHYYQNCVPANGQSGAAWFQGNVTNAYQTTGLPIWITEFACTGTAAQQQTFMQQVLPWLDSTSYVQKYSYFGAFEDILLNANGTGLSPLGITYATT